MWKNGNRCGKTEIDVEKQRINVKSGILFEKTKSTHGKTEKIDLRGCVKNKRRKVAGRVAELVKQMTKTCEKT